MSARIIGMGCSSSVAIAPQISAIDNIKFDLEKVKRNFPLQKMGFPLSVDDNTGCKFPFTNLVLQGGGAKGLAYSGSLKTLNELGIDKQLNKFAGASAGAFLAMMMALGASHEYICAKLEINIYRIIKDGARLDNMLGLTKNFGLHPGLKLLEFLGDICEELTGYRDITFLQVYQAYNRELCIVVADVTTSEAVFLHPKTYPLMPIRKAVRKSMSFPMVVAAVKEQGLDNHQHIFVDGGLFNNYPVRCFDGWYLSMKKENTFLNKIVAKQEELANKQKDKANEVPLPLVIGALRDEDRDSPPNKATIGLKLYGSGEVDISRVWKTWDEKLSQNINSLYQPVETAPVVKNSDGELLSSSCLIPETASSKAFSDKQDQSTKYSAENFKLASEIPGLLKTLKEMDTNGDGMINREEFMKMVPQLPKTTFGANSAELFDNLDVRREGVISFSSVIEFLEQHGFPMASIWSSRLPQNYEAGHVKALGKFFYDGIVGGLLATSQAGYLSDKDIRRTIPLDTKYVSALTKPEPLDFKFLFQVGRNTSRLWFESWLANNQ